MNVLKFGGSSVATAQTIQQVLQIVSNHSQKNNVFVVVSALGGITDLLLKAGALAASNNEDYKETLSKIEKRHLDTVRELIPVNNQSGVISTVKSKLNDLESLCEGAFLLSELSPKTSSVIASFGEILSSYIISEAAKSIDLDLTLQDSRDFITTIKAEKVTVNYEVTNAKIAAILASAVEAEELLIWTDVSGMFTANPRVVKQAKPVSHISYQEAMELSHFGAKVIYPPTIQPVLEKNIPIYIKNTFAPDDFGTLITREVSDRKQAVTGISHIENIAMVTLAGSGMVGIPGFSKRLFETLFAEKINVILITQASSEHSICLAIESKDADKAKAVIDAAFEFEISKGKVLPTKIETEIAILALVGDNMVNHQGLSGKMFSTLGKNNVNIRAIAQGASEKNISVVIAKKDIDKALNSLHEAFFEVSSKQLNLFITGVGNVGGKLIEQLQQQADFLKENLRLKVNVVALANSRKMVFDAKGINLNNWKENLENGESATPQSFFEKANALNLRNSIFVDNTATDKIASVYKNYLANSISVVTCNKIACADTYINYNELKQLSREYGASFLFETNVGAGLPIIDTLNNLIASGDRVRKIQAVLSGSLNFVFNSEDFNFSS